MEKIKQKQNELFIKKMMSMTNQWLWTDEGELYDIIDEKLYPKTKKGYEKVCRIVSKQFSNEYINPIK